jgi:hypothetical protein
MDSSKLLNWRILTNQVDYASDLNIVDTDMSNAMIVNSVTQIYITNSNIDKSSIQTGGSAHLIIDHSYGAAQYLLPNVVTSTNYFTFTSNEFKNSEFIFPNPVVYTGASDGLFDDCTDTDFSNSTFLHTGINTNSSALNFKTTIEGGNITGNNFSNCSFNSISLIDIGATLGTFALNIFDNSTFTGTFDIGFSVGAVTTNTNTFKNCTFQNDSVPFNSGINITIPGFDFSGSKFTSISIDLTDALIEGCQFFNCTGYDGAEFVPMAGDIATAMALRIGREYNFQINGRTYTVPAA